MDLYIEPSDNNRFIAYTQTATDKKYVIGTNNKPLKFVSVQHVKEYFQGYKFRKVALLDNEQ